MDVLQDRDIGDQAMAPRGAVSFFANVRIHQKKISEASHALWKTCACFYSSSFG